MAEPKLTSLKRRNAVHENYSSSSTDSRRSSTAELEQLNTARHKFDTPLKQLYENSRPKSYVAVKALFLVWEKCNLKGVLDETQELQTILREDYHFDAGEPKHIFQIPSQDQAEKLRKYLEDQISDFSNHDSKGDKLMIVYYNGHGGKGDPGLIISGGYGNETDWYPVHQQLFRIENFDVLLIMDCCYAARSIKMVPHKTMEVLCAVDGENGSGMDPIGAGPKSSYRSLFTTALKTSLLEEKSRSSGLQVKHLLKLLRRNPTLKHQRPEHHVITGYRPISLQPLKTDIQRSLTPQLDQSDDGSEPTSTSTGLNATNVSEGHPRHASEINSDWVVNFTTYDSAGYELIGAGFVDPNSAVNLMSKDFARKLGIGVRNYPTVLLDTTGGPVFVKGPLSIRIKVMSGGSVLVKAPFYILTETHYGFPWDLLIGESLIYDVGLLDSGLLLPYTESLRQQLDQFTRQVQRVTGPKQGYLRRQKKPSKQNIEALIQQAIGYRQLIQYELERRK